MEHLVKKLVSFCLSAVFTAGMLFPGQAAVSAAQTSDPAAEEVVIGVNSTFDYYKYSQKYISLSGASEEIVLDGADYVSSAGKVTRLEQYEGANGVVKIDTADEETSVTWDVDIPVAAKYQIQIKYYALENRGSNIQYGIKINGEYPFFGCDQLLLTKVWKNETNTFPTDKNGNQSRPAQIQVMTWQTAYVNDNQGTTNDPYMFVFMQGKQQLTFVGEMTDVIIDSIILKPLQELEIYSDVANQIDFQGSAGDAVPIILEGEQATYKSHSSIIPMTDRLSAGTSPNDPVKIYYNTVGSYNWQTQGEWITWEFDITESGIYNIGMRVRQNYHRGYSASRRIYIDGKVPFQELDNVEFAYGNNWYIKKLGDEEPYRFYFEKGRHTISMEVVPGNTCELYQTLKDSVYELNRIYRRILMVTGTTPDSYRDYYLENEIPNLEEDLTNIRNKLNDEYNRLQSVYGQRDSDTATMERLVVMIDSFLDDFETIPARLTTFMDNISALSSWMVRLKEQPLELDYIEIVPEGTDFRKGSAGFFASAKFIIEQFIGSFFIDYNSIGEDGGEDALDVWIGLGRDQVQVIRELVDNRLKPKAGFNVSIKLAKDSIIQATYAGTGPDVALFVSIDQPVNLAVRGALVDLSKFDDYQDVAKWFSPEASVPYQYNGGVYALPVTGTFNMLFYRTDIFQELELTPPETWDDLYQIIPVLQQNNMNIGLPKVAMDTAGTTGLSAAASSIFDTLLLQKNLTYYTPDRSRTCFDSQGALDAFKEWTGYYTKYDVPLDFDFYNRFRSGEMPIGIDTYAMYNKLYLGAPEIAGNWEMIHLPGTVQEDGTINYAAPVTGTGAIIFNNDCNQDNAWEFIKWFTSAEIQAEYGRQIEALLGSAARYDTANLEAFEMLPWSNAQQKQLLTQWNEVKGIPQIPASYYVSRNLYNAFRNVTLNNSNPREILYKYNQEINREIERKRVEFGLD